MLRPLLQVANCERIAPGAALHSLRIAHREQMQRRPRRAKFPLTFFQSKFTFRRSLSSKPERSELKIASPCFRGRSHPHHLPHRILYTLAEGAFSPATRMPDISCSQRLRAHSSFNCCLLPSAPTQIQHGAIISSKAMLMTGEHILTCAPYRLDILARPARPLYKGLSRTVVEGIPHLSAS